MGATSKWSFQASAHVGSIMPTLLDGAEYTRVSWEQSLSDVSGFKNWLVRLYSQLLLSA
jgi:hypothetical protein